MDLLDLKVAQGPVKFVRQIITDYNRIFDERRVAKLDLKICQIGLKRRLLIKEALKLTNRRENILGQKPTRKT